MKSLEKQKPARGRSGAGPNRDAGTRAGARPSAEDERDLRDALRAREEAEREGSYPWEQLKREIEE